jgi:hypothetical protein
MTGLFTHQTRSHRGPGRQAIAARRDRPFDRTKLDTFAEALAETGTITAAAKRCGISQQRGSALFKRICAGLGEQAR